MADIPIIQTPVLIIGSSMVGMTLSVLLAKHGVRDHLTIERHASTAIHPRAALFHPRTMQIYRELGLYDAMKAESLKHYDEHAGLHGVDTLAKGEGRTWMADINEGLEDISPTSRMFLTQQMFEPLLRDYAANNGAELRFSTELLDFQQDEQGVTALIRNTETGAKQLVQAQYMVACDGNRSPVREKLGIKMKGHGLLSHSLTIYFKADLGRFVEGKYNGVIYVNNPEIRGFFRLDKTGREGFLVVNTAGEQGTEASRFPANDITNERAAEILRAAIGADVEFEITLLSPWRAVCDVAERFQEGRVLLAGDAAHTVTPHGGFGGNTGIQDAHNLAWKLATVLEGRAGEDLIGTYEAERKPVAKKTVDQVFARYIIRTAPELEEEHRDDIEEEIPEPHLELGYQYHSRGLTTNALPNGSVASDPGTAKAGPGTMAHHVMVTTAKGDEVGGTRTHPIADLFGHNYTLLVGHEGIGWVRAARNFNAENSDKSLPVLDVHQLSPGNEAFHKKYALSPLGCVLVRPDGFIAWAEAGAAVHGFGAVGMPAPEDRLRCVMRDILCLPSEIRGSSNGSIGSRSSMSVVDSQEKQSSLVTKVTETLGSVRRDAAKRSELVRPTAEGVFAQRKELERERKELEDRIAVLDAKLGDLKRMDELQNEMALLGVKLGRDSAAQH